MSNKIIMLAVLMMTILNVGILAINVSTSTKAKVGGKDQSDLVMDLDFRQAVEAVIQECTVDGFNISC